MHACDTISTSLADRTAKLLAAMKDQWHGTLVLNAVSHQKKPSDGARAMLADGCTRASPSPTTRSPCTTAPTRNRKIGYTPGYALRQSTSVDVTIRGRGAHGSRPEVSKDPSCSPRIHHGHPTIVSRENSPFDPPS